MDTRAKEQLFAVLRWLGMLGTFACVVSALGTFALGSLYGRAAHIVLAFWLVLGLLCLSLWIFAQRKMRAE